MPRSTLIVLALVVLPASAFATRPLATDRPDRTESPYSVPAGWLQVETDLVSHGRFERDDVSVTGTTVFAFNAKYGLTRRVDAQFVFAPWFRAHTERSGLPTEENSGTGQAGLRAKINLVGNDRGNSAIALLPFAFVPTRGDAIFDAVTWGLVAPVSFGLDGDRAFSAMVGFVRLNNEDTWLISSFSLASPIAGNLAAFVEVYVAMSGFEEGAPNDTTIDSGLTYALGPDWQLDTGVYYGITSSTEDWRVFAGASARFSLSSP